MSERRILIETARAIVDGEEVDWQDLTRTHPGLEGRLRNLRLLSQLVDYTDTEIGPTLAPGDRWGSLQIRERVGEGSFGEVYRAYEPALDREVALKIHRDGDGSLQLDEARRLARVRHPHVLPIHGVERHGGHAGMWTDFIEGRTLEEWIEELAPVGEAELVRIGTTLCGALAAVHDADLVHADVKAANVMIESGGRLVLMDFGAGREAMDDRDGSVPRPAFGTPLVMAPELLHGASPTVASDLYAVGVLLYRLATGRYPVEAETREELLARIAANGIPPLDEARPDLAPDVIRGVTAALALDRVHRPVSARALAATLGGGVADPAAEPRAIPGRPAFDTRFVGRRTELGEIRARLVPNAVVTLLGPGGSGKTRLAHEAVSQVVDAFPGGAIWIDLVPLTDADAVALELCRLLELRVTGATPPLDVVCAHLGGRGSLLVFDNAEHLTTDVARLLGELRSRCVDVAALVTSRRPLDLDGESILAVEPLSVPSADDGSSARVLDSDAGRLFVVRATSARSTFRLTDANAPNVARICRSVDGIPLALELAAARISTLGEAELATRLDRSLGLLRDRTGERRPQHETVRALLDWSLDLLSEPARRLFDRLSVFVGGWTLTAAEYVCADGPPQTASLHELRNPGGPNPIEHPPRTTIGEEEIADLLTDLVEQSLVVFHSGETARYRMLELVRAVARERLAATDEPEETRRLAWRHHDWHRDLSLRFLGQFRGEDAVPWMQRMGREIDNLRAAIELRPASDAEVLSRLGLLHAAGTWWRAHGLHREGIRFLQQVRDLPSVEGDLHFRASVFNTLGNLYTSVGENDLGRQALEQCVAIERDRPNPGAIAIPLSNLGAHFIEVGDYARADEHLAAALRIFEEVGDRSGQVYAVNLMGVSRQRAGDDPAALGHYLRGLELQRMGATDFWGIAMSLNNVAGSLLRQDRAVEALSHAEEGLIVLRELADPVELAGSLVTLANIFLKLGRLPESKNALVEVAEIHDRIDHPFGVLHASGMWGLYLVETGCDEDATLALAFCLHWAERSGIPLATTDREEVETHLQALRDRLGDRFEPLASRANKLTPRELFAMFRGREEA